MLGKFVWEVDTMPIDEFVQWNALVELERKEEASRKRKAQLQSKTQGSVRGRLPSR